MEQYYSEKQRAPLQLKKLHIRLNQVQFELFSGSAVFSKDKLDKGTAVLLEHMRVPECSSVLDIGCGIGVVGIAVLKTIPRTSVTFSDVNERALQLTKKNLHLHRLKAEVVSSFLYDKLGMFDVILANPPQRAGKKVCEQLVRDAHQHLNPGGHLQFVIRKNKGGESLSKVAAEVFGSFNVLAKKGGYWVYDCEKH